MIYSVKNLNFNNNYQDFKSYKNKNTTPTVNTSETQYQLPNYKIAQAIFAGNNVMFKKNLYTNSTSNETLMPINTDHQILQTQYRFKANTLKDYYTAQYTNDLLIFLTPTFHSEESSIKYDLNIKNNNYHNLIFDASSDNSINTVDNAIKKQQELFQALCNTNFDSVLNGIKEYSIELINEDEELTIAEKEKRIKTTESITSQDIKTYIDTFLRNKKPEILILEKEPKYDD